MTNHEMKLGSKTNSVGNLKISTRTYLSRGYLSGACLFARDTWRLENSADSNHGLSGDKRTQSTHYARASIIFSFSSIEAAINEFFQDIIEKSSTPEAIQELCEADIAKLSAWWKGKNTKGQNNRKPTLRKYKAVIEIIGDYKMNQNYSEDQSIDKFRDFNSLRNILIHYTPEYSDRLRIHQKADEIFEKYDIPINSFFINTQNPIFPSKCMGHGLSKWCIETAIEFIDHFYCTLGLSSKLDICRHELKTR